MPVITVDDRDDPRISLYSNIPDAALLEQHGLFVAEGRLVVRRLLASPRFDLCSLMVTPAALRSIADAVIGDISQPVFVVPQSLMNAITGFNMHRGCLALGRRRRPETLDDVAANARLLVVTERVANADNIGGIFRNAAAFGADGVVLDPWSTDPLYRKAIRTSMAAALHVPFARTATWPDALEQLAGLGLTLVALTPSSEVRPLHAVAASHRHQRVAIVLGHEGEGLTAVALSMCHAHARIPMAGGVDSLNVASAAAVALYELSRFR